MSLPVQFIQDLWVRKCVHLSCDARYSHLLTSSFRTFGAAGHTLLVYDYLLTLDDEVSSLLRRVMLKTDAPDVRSRSSGILLGRS